MKVWSKPLFRWAGSKSKLLPILIKNTPSKINSYIEPFCGSACLFFALKPSKAILSDINSELIHAYKLVLRHPRILQRNVNQMPTSKEYYLELRQIDPKTLNDLQRAERFIYLNRYCFNAVYRTNKKGQFNVPMGTKTGKVPSQSHFYRTSYGLRAAQLVAQGYTSITSSIKKNDFVYLDPPYMKKGSTPRGEYGPNSFSYDEIPQILDVLHEIVDRKANFLFSYSSDKELNTLLKKSWYVEEVVVQRHVAGFAKHRSRVAEILVSNNAIKL